MTPLLLASIITITIALIFYTVGVFSEFKNRYLEKKHSYLFAAGLLFDALGTYLMSTMSSRGERHLSDIASVLMTISGSAALFLMSLHLVISVVFIWKNIYRSTFHIVSLSIWSLWMIAYLLGPIGLFL